MTYDFNDALYIHPDFLELQDYLGTQFKLEWCDASDTKGKTDANSGYKSNDDFIRNTMVFCYQSIGLMAQGIHRPYISKLLDVTHDMGSCSVLDYGSGGGQIGLALHTLGYKVSFADLYSQSSLFLSWRLRRRGLNLPVYLLDFASVVIPHHNIAVCFDVIEHCDHDEQLRIIHHLADLADSVFINLIRGTGGEIPGLHFEVNPEELTSYISNLWPCWSSDYYKDDSGVYKQRLIIYGEKVRVEAKN